MTTARTSRSFPVRQIRLHADRYEIVTPDPNNEGGRLTIGFVTRATSLGGWVPTDPYRQTIGEPCVAKLGAVRVVRDRFIARN